jgi:hypothetical protein
MANIWNITAQFIELASLIEEAGGELTPEMEQELTITRESFAAKAEGYANLILKLESEAEAAATEIKRVQAIKKTKENTVLRLRDALLQALMVFGQEDAKGIRRHETDLLKISTRKSQSVEITDEDALPELFWVIKKEISKSAISNALKAGEEIEGAALRENISLTIR